MAVEQFALLSSPFLTNIVLPFILIFTVVFAILEKTKLLGKDKSINWIVGLIFSLVAIGVPAAVGVLSRIIPVIAIILVIFLAWFLVFGFIGVDVKWPDGLKKTFLVLIGVILLGVIVWSVGLFDYITLDTELASKVMQITLLIGAIIAVIAIVVGGTPPIKDE